MNYAAQLPALYSELNLQCLNKFSLEGAYFDTLSQSGLLEQTVVAVFTLLRTTHRLCKQQHLQTLTNT